MVRVSERFLKGFLDEGKLNSLYESSKDARELLYSKQGKGNDFLGWVDLPAKISKKEISDLEETAEEIASDSEYLVVVGIGGSYLGARAVIEANVSPFQILSKKKKKSCKVIYAGHNIDADYHSELYNFLEDKDFSVNVISKSGTTTEPALAFRRLLEMVKKKYGKKSIKNRVFSTTDAKKGALKQLSDEYKLKTFVIPDDVGGRYSVLTPVGLLPIAASGVDIEELIKGAISEYQKLKETPNPRDNHACKYAVLRNTLYQSGKKLEVMMNYNAKLHYFSEWWKQLYGESEGKEGKGIFPASVDFTTDLHSLGQYLQDGERMIFETLLNIENPNEDLTLKDMEGDPDGLNYLSSKTLSYVNSRAILGTQLAHYEGGVPIIEISVPALNPETCGELIYFFEYACGVSGYMLGVNPFDQPGVEGYKNNMFALLGKKGYEEKKKIVEEKLKNF